MTSPDDAKFLKKHIKTGNIDVHPTEKALIVNYELEATILGELGDPMVGDRKECQKLIRLKDLSESTDISALAREVVEKCKLIPFSKIPEIEQILFYLQKRGDGGGGKVGGVLPVDVGGFPGSDESGERASISKLEEYIEMLYEDVPEKVKGTSLVLQLARNPDNLEELIQNETLLGALARVLREDWKKEMELATNIVYAFFCFSTFSQFHKMISHFKVGALCMQILEYEIQRYELWKEDFQKKSTASAKEIEKNRKKFLMLTKRQEQLLRVCLYLLLNLSEDLKTEIKMVNRGILELLCKLLDRKENAELLILVATFLKKLSVFSENIKRLSKENIVERVGKVFPSANEDLALILLKLLFNLSFNTDLRKKIVGAALLNHIVPYISNEIHEDVATKLLYHMSMEDSCKGLFTYTDCIHLAMKILLERDECPLPLKSLLVNLVINKRNAQLLAGEDGKGLKLLVEMAFLKGDPILLKIVRNIAEHDGPTKPMFIEFVTDIAEGVRRDETNSVSQFGIECLGILGCLNLPELDWNLLLNEFQLLNWMKTKLVPGGAEDDVVLELVILLGTVASDPNGAEYLFKEGVVDSLLSLLSAKQEDDEIVLQIIYVFYQMMFHDSLRKKLLEETQVPAYLIDLMHDKNREIRKMSDNTLDVISEAGEEWAVKIQEEKFRWHNAQWLDMLSEANQNNNLEPNDNYDRADLFEGMYGLQAEDILENYENENQQDSGSSDECYSIYP